MKGYYANIKYDKKEGVWLVSFPDLPEVNTWGKTKEDAIAMAKEALEGYVLVASNRKALPDAKKRKGLVWIELSEQTSFAIWLREQREKCNMSQSDMAKALGIKYQTYQRFEDPAKSNPTLKTIAKIKQALKIKELVL